MSAFRASLVALTACPPRDSAEADHAAEQRLEVFQVALCDPRLHLAAQRIGFSGTPAHQHQNHRNSFHTSNVDRLAIEVCDCVHASRIADAVGPELHSIAAEGLAN